MESTLLTDTSKFLSYVLRHEPHAIGLQLDSEGWAAIDQLIAGAATQGRVLDSALIAAVVQSNAKKRFALSADGQRIRAVQGHSTASVNVQHVQQVPPEVLYHGTARRFLAPIQEKGLIAGARHHVHLAQEAGTAVEVGRRYGEPVVLKVAARRMHEAGFVFYRAENGVWLTDRVPVEWIVKVGERSSNV